MLVLEHLALFLSALASAKYALLDRRAPYTTMPASIVFFAAFAISSFYLEVGTGAGLESTSSLGMFTLGLGGFLFMSGMLILEIIDALPEVRTDGALSDSVQRSDPTRGETGNDPRQKRGD